MVALNIAHDRTLVDVHYCGRQLKFSELSEQHPASTRPYSPDDLRSVNATAYWLQYAVYYQLPHIQRFSSWHELIEKLSSTDFDKVNKQVYAENLRRKARLIRDWQSVLSQIDSNPRMIPKDYETALRQLWNTTRLQAV